MKVIPQISSTATFHYETCGRFGGIQLDAAQTFPMIEESDNICQDALPHLCPRRKRQYLRGIPGEVKMIYPYGDGIAALTSTEEGLFLYIPSKENGTYSVQFPQIPLSASDTPCATWFGKELFFPEYGMAVNTASRKCCKWEKHTDFGSGIYGEDEFGEPTLTVHFVNSNMSSRVESFSAGEYVRLYAMSLNVSKIYLLQIYNLDVSADTFTFRGEGLPPEEVFASGNFAVFHSFPTVIKQFAACKDRLWAWDGEETLYASVPGDPHSFFTPKDLPAEQGGLTFYPGFHEKILAFTSFGGQPLCLTGRAVIRVAGDVPEDFHSEVCEKYGLAQGAENTIAAMGENLFFCSDRGLCRYSGTDTELVAPIAGIKGGYAVVTGSRYFLWDGNRYFYIYDMDSGVLTREPADPIRSMAVTGAGVFCLSEAEAASERYVTCIDGRFPENSSDQWREEDGSVFSEESVVESNVRFFPFSFPERRTVVRSVMIEAALETDSELTVLVGYDNNEPIPLKTFSGKAERKRLEIPVPSKACERFTLCLKAKGEYTVFSVGICKREG